MFNLRQAGAQGRRITFGLVGRDPHRCDPSLRDGTLEKGLGCFGVPPCREVGIHHLAVLVDRPVDVGPFPV